MKPSSPVRSAQNEKPASMAIAPAARLMKPEPRYVIDDADRDGGDRGPGPEAEQEEEEYLVHVVPWESADGAGVEPAPSDEGSSFVDCYLPGGPIQPDARLNANLPW